MAVKAQTAKRHFLNCLETSFKLYIFLAPSLDFACQLSLSSHPAQLRATDPLAGAKTPWQ